MDEMTAEEWLEAAEYAQHVQDMLDIAAQTIPDPPAEWHGPNGLVDVIDPPAPKIKKEKK